MLIKIINIVSIEPLSTKLLHACTYLSCRCPMFISSYKKFFFLNNYFFHRIASNQIRDVFLIIQIQTQIFNKLSKFSANTIGIEIFLSKPISIKYQIIQIYSVRTQSSPIKYFFVNFINSKTILSFYK